MQSWVIGLTSFQYSMVQPVTSFSVFEQQLSSLHLQMKVCFGILFSIYTKMLFSCLLPKRLVQFSGNNNNTITIQSNLFKFILGFELYNKRAKQYNQPSKSLFSIKVKRPEQKCYLQNFKVNILQERNKCYYSLINVIIVDTTKVYTTMF